MKETLKRELLKSLFRFKKTGLSISRYLVSEMHSDLNIPEICALTCIHEHTAQGCSGGNAQCRPGKGETSCDAMHSMLSVSKAAVSQTLGTLEKKGYVERAIDRDNRRKIVITLTDSGRAALEHSNDALDSFIVSLINRFGEAKTSRLIGLINDFAELVESLEKEPIGDA